MDSFFGIGMMELFFIALIALIVLGPERMPGAIREVMKTIRYVRNLSSELTSQFSDEFKDLEDLNPQKILQDIAGDLDEEDGKKTAATKPGAAKSTTKPAAAKPAAKPAPKPASHTPSKPAAQTTPKPKTPEATTKAQSAEEAKPADTGAGAAAVSGEQPENAILPPQAAMQEPSPPSAVGGQAIEPAANAGESVAPVAGGSTVEMEPASAARRAPLSVNGNSAAPEGEG